MSYQILLRFRGDLCGRCIRICLDENVLRLHCHLKTDRKAIKYNCFLVTVQCLLLKCWKMALLHNVHIEISVIGVVHIPSSYAGIGGNVNP